MLNDCIKILVRLYYKLLRLYPPRFRGQFADEMLSVFRLAYREHQTPAAKLRFLLHETLTMAVCLAGAHWHEYRQQPAFAYEGGMMVLPQQSTRLFRWTIRSTVALAVAFAVLVVLPFFLLGLHTLPTEQVISGGLDPKGFSLYGDSSQSENLLYVVTILCVIIAPVVGIAHSIFAAAWLLLHRRSLNLKQVMMGGTAVLLGTSLLAFVLSPLGRVIYLWLLD